MNKVSCSRWSLTVIFILIHIQNNYLSLVLENLFCSIMFSLAIYTIRMQSHGLVSVVNNKSIWPEYASCCYHAYMDTNMVNEGKVDEIITKFHWKWICKQNRKLKGGKMLCHECLWMQNILNISELWWDSMMCIRKKILK